MSCVRCGGMVVIEKFDDEKSTRLRFVGARCLNCGSIDDPLIRANRVRLPYAGAAGQTKESQSSLQVVQESTPAYAVAALQNRS